MTQKILPANAYVIDTSALIDLFRGYPPDVFGGLWKLVEAAVAKGDLVAPEEVLDELAQKDDELLRWAKRHRRMFRRLDAGQVAEAQRVLADFPGLVDIDKTIPDADPFVVALGKMGYIVVTSEKPKGPGGRPTIPSVCAGYKIRCIDLLQLFRDRGWKWTP